MRMRSKKNRRRAKQTAMLSIAFLFLLGTVCPCLLAAEKEEQVQKITIQYPPQFEDLLKLKAIQRLDRPLLLNDALEQFDIKNSDLGKIMMTGDLELIVGGGVQSPPERPAAEVLLLEAMGMAPRNPEVLAAVTEWHLWELEKPQINEDALFFHSDLHDRWIELEPENSAPRIARAFLYWRMGNRMAAIEECKAALKCDSFDNHSRFQQQCVIRACEYSGFSAAPARDRAMGVGTGIMKAFRAVSSQLLRSSTPEEAEPVAALLDRLAQEIQPDCRTLVQEEAVLATRQNCLEYLAKLPLLRENSLMELSRVKKRKEALAELLNHHRNRRLNEWSEQRWVAFFNRAIEQGEEKAMRYEADTEKR